MKRLLLSIVALFFFSGIAVAQAEEPIPFQEFVSITNKALDTVDELEMLFRDPDSSKRDIDLAYKKLETAAVKYMRYVPDWREVRGKQADIVKAVAGCNFFYYAALMQGRDGKFHEKAKQSTQEAYRLFLKYKR